MTAQGPTQRTSGIHSLRSASVVVFEQSAQTLTTDNLASGLADRIVWLNDLVLEPLVISFGMVVADELADRVPEHLLAEEDHLFQAIGFDRPDPAFREGIEIWTLRRQADRFYAGSFQDLTKLLSELVGQGAGAQGRRTVFRARWESVPAATGPR